MCLAKIRLLEFLFLHLCKNKLQYGNLYFFYAKIKGVKMNNKNISNRTEKRNAMTYIIYELLKGKRLSTKEMAYLHQLMLKTWFIKSQAYV